MKERMKERMKDSKKERQKERIIMIDNNRKINKRAT